MTASNDTRAERAQAALQSYVEAKGEVFENSSSEIADLIVDLLHLAVRIDRGDEAMEPYVTRRQTLERITLVGLRPQSDSVFNALTETGFCLECAGPYTDCEMAPAVDNSRFLIVAQKEITL